MGAPVLEKKEQRDGAGDQHNGKDPEDHTPFLKIAQRHDLPLSLPGLESCLIETCSIVSRDA
jgi:hypothetical protein